MGEGPLGEDELAARREGAGKETGDVPPMVTQNGGRSVEERAENGEHLDGPAPVGGDTQLSLDVGKTLKPNARRVLEATISLSAAERPVDGLFRPDVLYPFLVMGEAGQVTSVYVKDPKTKTTKGVKQRQGIAVDTVRRADDPEVVRELFAAVLGADAESAGRLLEQLQQDAAAALQAA